MVLPTHFIENLTLPTWWLAAWPRLLLQRVRSGAGTRCYVIDGSPMLLALARLSARPIGARVERLSFRLVDVRDEAGRLLRLRIAYQDLAEVQQEAISEPVFRDLVGRGVGGEVLTYLAKNIASVSLSNRGVMWRALLVVQVCAWKSRQLHSGGAPAVLYLERRPWQEAIRRYAARSGVRVITVPPAVVVRQLVREALGPQGIGLLHLLRRRLAARGRDRDVAPAMRAPSVDGASAAAGGPRIVVPYLGHLNLDQPQQYSDLFLWQQSSLRGSDLLVTFQTPADPLDAGKWTALSAHGIAAVALHSGAATVPGVPLIVPRPGLRRGRLGLAPQVTGRTPEAAWLRRQLETYDALRAQWTALFAAFNAKVYVSWYKYDATHCIIADALQSLGGVTAIYQRSYEDQPSAEATVDADVVFSFSGGAAEIERRSHSTICYHVVTGYLGDHRFPLLRERARAIGDALRRNGAEYVVAYADENSVDDSRWHTGHEFMRVNYAFLLERLLADPHLGLVIKPKVPATLRRRLGPVADLLERAAATGRCYVFEGGAMHGSHPPAVAALTADVMIHGHLCAATAGMEAALAGVPTLLLDREGWPVSPLYRLGEGRVVFRDWPALWAAVLDHRRTPGGIPGFGDWSPMLPELDPFRDGRAAERMGTYLQWLIEGFKAGLDRERVMADAAGRYAERWGADKVTTVAGPWGTQMPGMQASMTAAHEGRVGTIR